MNRVLKILAIAALLATIAGAGAVLYGLRTLVPEAAQATVTAIPAAQAADTLEAARAQVEGGTFAGRVFSETRGVEAEDAWFVTVNVRLRNRGFFPAEWIALTALPREDAQSGARDMLQLDNYGANVLAPGSEGDISATLLTSIEPGKYEVVLEASCYVLGQKHTFRIQAR